MKWVYSIKHKSKTAALLLVIVVLILGSSFLEKACLHEMNDSVTSIYKDRLIPSAELFQLNDHLYARRLLLERHLLNPSVSNPDQIRQELTRHNLQMDSIIREFETTYLVDEESKTLKNIKAGMHRYSVLEEASLLAFAHQPNHEHYARNLAPVFNQIHGGFQELSTIQTTVGKQLYRGSERIEGNASALGYLQVAIVVVIALCIQALLLSQRSVAPKKMPDFRWN